MAANRRLRAALRGLAAAPAPAPAPAAAPAAAAPAPAAAAAASEAPDFAAVIVGTGFSGLLCAMYLKEAGVASDAVRIFEMTPAVGGVWSSGGVGAYPGAACDVPAYTYLPCLDRTKFAPSKKCKCSRSLCVFCRSSKKAAAQTCRSRRSAPTPSC